MTAVKAIAFTIHVGKVVSLLFNILSRFIIALPPRSKCLLISWFQSPSAVILEPEKIWQHSFSVLIWAFPVVVMVVGCMSFSCGASASSLSLVAQLVKNLLVIQVNEVRSLGREEPRRREWQPTPVFLLENSMDRGAWRATVQEGLKELDKTE